MIQYFYILKWSQQTSYHLSVYKVCQHTGSLTIFLVCTLHPRELFILQLEVCTLNPLHLFHLPPPTLLPSVNHQFVLYIYESVSVLFVHLFCFIESSYKWNYAVIVFLCLTYFSYPNTLQVYPCCCKSQDFILFLWLSNMHTVISLILFAFHYVDFSFFSLFSSKIYPCFIHAQKMEHWIESTITNPCDYSDITLKYVSFW